MKNKLLIERYTLPYKITEVKADMVREYLGDYTTAIFDIEYLHDCVKLTLYGVK